MNQKQEIQEVLGKKQSPSRNYVSESKSVEKNKINFSSESDRVSRGLGYVMKAWEVIAYILLGLFPVFELSCYFMMWTKREDVSFKKRNTNMILVCSIASWIAYLNLIFSLWDFAICGIYYTIFILLPPLTVGPQLLRGVTLWGMLEHNKLILKHGETAHLRRTIHHSSLDVVQEVSSKLDEESGRVVENANESLKRSAKRQAKETRRKMKLTVKVIKCVLICIPLILFTLMLSLSPQDHLQATGMSQCFPEPDFIVHIGRGFAIFFIILAIISMVLVRHCNDALGIRREITRNIIILLGFNVTYFVLTALKHHHILMILYILQQMLLSISMILIPCYFSSGSSVLSQIKSRSKTQLGYGRPIPNIQTGRASIIGAKQRTPMEKEREREMTMSLDAGLCVLLSSDSGLESFTEHCAMEFSVENIRFWCVVSDFHKAVDILRAPTCEDKSEHDETDIRTFAEEIFDTYVRPGAEMEINISSDQRMKIKEQLSNSATIYKGVFDSAQREIYALMSRHSYPRFLALKNNKELDEEKKRNQKKVTPT